MPIWDDFTEQANRQLVPRIDGDFTGTTGEILTWGAGKWGLDADILGAVAVQESHWRQNTLGDKSDDVKDCVGGATPPCPTSFGIMQLKYTYLVGSYPLSQRSTAFNVDYYGARTRLLRGVGHLPGQRLRPRRHLALRGLALVRSMERRRRAALHPASTSLPRGKPWLDWTGNPA